jgi:GDP-mannose transporter
MIPVVACVAYSLTSMSMTLLNKYILSQHKFEYPFLLLLWQNTFAVGLIYMAKGTDLLKVENLEPSKVKKWLPINLFFIAMLVTHSLSLNRLSVPVVTVFKNLTTVGVALGDCLMLGHEITSMMFMSAVLMFSGSLVAGWTDLEFDLLGYEWMLCNCVASAAYLLYLKHTIKVVQLSEFGMVLYNNALSIPIALAWSLLLRSAQDHGKRIHRHTQFRGGDGVRWTERFAGEFDVAVVRESNFSYDLQYGWSHQQSAINHHCCYNV